MACGGENTGNYFTSIFTLIRSLITNLSKNVRSEHFYTNFLSPPITSSIIFDSEYLTLSVKFPQVADEKKKNKHICRHYYENFIWN